MRRWLGGLGVWFAMHLAQGATMHVPTQPDPVSGKAGGLVSRRRVPVIRYEFENHTTLSFDHSLVLRHDLESAHHLHPASWLGKRRIRQLLRTPTRLPGGRSAQQECMLPRQPEHDKVSFRMLTPPARGGGFSSSVARTRNITPRCGARMAAAICRRHGTGASCASCWNRARAPRPPRGWSWSRTCRRARPACSRRPRWTMVTDGSLPPPSAGHAA